MPLNPQQLSAVGPDLAFSTAASFTSNTNWQSYGGETHGLSEVLYAFASAGNNNGSAFAGLTANEPFYNTTLGLAMLAARFLLMVPTLAVVGALARKRYTPPSAGTLPTHTPLFVVLVAGTVVLVGALAFIPALALRPIVEHLQMIRT